MTDAQWQLLLRVLRGEDVRPRPVGFIIDCPWLAGWHNLTLLDYFTDDEAWLSANLRAVREFPDVLFLPGFWSEYAMSTEPSAFGCKCIWPENEFPHPERILDDISQAGRVKKPDCRTDGMLPFVIKRLRRCQGRIEAAGHRIRFAVARGHMNIASYLMGQTEFLTALKTDPEPVHRLLELITDFLVEWLDYQREVFPSIDGVLVLDDLIGFVGRADFESFALPYLTRMFDSQPVAVKALHNDARGLVTARHLAAMGVNLFNFSFEHGMAPMRELVGPGVTLLGNIPPRDVLARGTPDDVRRSVAQALVSIGDHRWVIWSAGGGTPPGVSSENLAAFAEAVRAAG